MEDHGVAVEGVAREGGQVGVDEQYSDQGRCACLPSLVGDGFTRGRVLVLIVGAESLVCTFRA
jgi:hypothetical protein